MAQLFDDVFNPSGIYNTLFFNVKSVLIFPTIEKLEKENPAMYSRWLYLSRTKYNYKFPHDTKEQMVYETKAPYHPEFTKIVAITYATLYVVDGTLKRYMKKIVNDDEFIVLATFMDELYNLSTDGAHSTPQQFPVLCGHNILGHDIPLLVKKFVFYRDKFEINKQIPLILKRSLSIKPWESGVIDTVNVWKFNGYDNVPLMLICDYLGLKKTVDLLPHDEVSQLYWNLIDAEGNNEKALEFISLQSATQTNLVIQLMNEMRQL